MRWHRYLMAAAVSMAMALAVVGNASAEDFGTLVKRVNKASSTKAQATYSQQLHKSINAGSVQRLEQNCAQQHPRSRVQTFTMVGVMRLDGVLKAPTMLPENAFTICVAASMDSVNFPLPPGNQSGWAVAIQFDGTSGKVLYMDGDKQPAMPRYARSSSASKPWMFTPVPIIPSKMRKGCTTSVWLSVKVSGRVDEVDVADSNCPKVMQEAVVDAAHQWIYRGTPGKRRQDSMDVKLAFVIDRNRIQLKF